MTLRNAFGELALDTTLQTLNTLVTALGQLVAALNAKTAVVDTDHVSIMSMPAVTIGGTVPVSGNFYPATQPVSVAGSVAVTGAFYQTTQPVSAAALPLPAGAATQTTLAAIDAKLASSLPLPAGAASQLTLAAIDTKLGAPLAVTGTFFLSTQPISAASLPLPDGAASEVTASFIKTAVQGLKTNTGPADVQRVAIDFRDGASVQGTMSANGAFPVIDLLGYSMVAIQFITYGVGTVTFQQSEDQTTWENCYGMAVAGTSTQSFTITSRAGMVFSRKFRYFRMVISSWTAGTMSFVGTLSKSDYFASMNGVTQAVSIAGPSTGTMTTPAITATASVVLASNTARKSMTIVNDAASLSRVYLAMSATAPTLTTYTTWLDPGMFLTTSQGDWVGAVGAICATGGTATLHVTEQT